MITEEEIEFLKESNAIEGEYSKEALEDSIEAWRYAKKFIDFERKIDIPMIKTVHKLLLKRLDSRIAGKIRKIPIYVGTRTDYRECLKPEKIDDELRKWCREGNKRLLHSPKDSAIGTIGEIHVKFENIHPFEDGNGRVGRILMNLQRLRSAINVLVIHEGKEQQDYYKWFKTQKNGNQKGVKNNGNE